MINPRDQYNTNKQGQQQAHSFWHTQQLWQQQADMSIYSPSFPYHIYDSINLPGEQQQHQQQHQQQQQHQPYTYGRTSTTTTPSNNNYNYLSHTLNLNHNQSHNTASSLCRKSSSCNTSKTYSNFRRNARQYLYEYRTIVEYSIALILIAFTLLTIIKFTLFTSSQAPNYQQTYQKTPNLQPLPRTQEDEYQIPITDKVPLRDSQIDTLKSKLIIGQFIILSQNYSQFESQRTLLIDRIVKLMDQWILASEFRPNYSRTEVTGIRQNRPSGIIVDCNIILNESIGFAAPLFGTAFYNSLVRNQDRLANMPNYIIDKNSIKFSTVPDNDIRRGIVPPGLLSPSVARELAPSAQSLPPAIFGGEPDSEESSMGLMGQTSLGHKLLVEPKMSPQEPLEQMNLVVWSAWSAWSSCVDKNGVCDPGRLHSRLRTCNHQITGEKVDVNQCKQRFNSMDLDLEVEMCARTCSFQQSVGSLSLPPEAPVQSDAPSLAVSVGPQTAPAVLQDSYLGLSGKPALASSASGLRASAAGPSANSKEPLSLQELYTPASAVASSSSSSSSSDEQQLAMSSTERQPQSISSTSTSDIQSGELAKMPVLSEQQVSCSNCTSDEICLLLISQKVPFCAKVKDRQDDSGCGGWCKGANQICQSVGANAFKCIHDSECLPEEWRCHDSQCIPLTKRCDGHSNCYDSSDERDCPA